LKPKSGKEFGWTHDPSSHSGSTRLPPPLTPGSHDFFGAAAATTMSLLGLTVTAAPTLPPIAVARRVWLLFPPLKKEDPNPFNTAPDVAAAISLYTVLWRDKTVRKILETDFEVQFANAALGEILCVSGCEVGDNLRGSDRRPSRTMKSVEEILSYRG